MTFHGLKYDRERATATLRIKLSKRRLALGEQDGRGFKCKPLEHECSYPGGIMFWEPKPCPAVAIYTGTLFSDGAVYRTPTSKEVQDATRLHEMGGCSIVEELLLDSAGDCR